MAKKHVALRYAQIENEYLEMQSLLKELNDDLSNNLIDVAFIKLNEFMDSFLSNNINYDNSVVNKHIPE